MRIGILAQLGDPQPCAPSCQHACAGPSSWTTLQHLEDMHTGGVLCVNAGKDTCVPMLPRTVHEHIWMQSEAKIRAEMITMTLHVSIDLIRYL